MSEVAEHPFPRSVERCARHPYAPAMKFFRIRGRNSAGRTTSTPVDRAHALYKAGRYAEAVAEARAVARSLPGEDTYAPLALSIMRTRRAPRAVTPSSRLYDDVLPGVGRIFGAGHCRP